MKLVNKSIVLDLDGVIADIDKSVSNYLQQDGSVDDPSYAEWFTTNTKNPEALKLFGNSLFWKNIKPFSDAFFQINYWASIGYEINVVTARRQEASVKEAMPWLNKWHIEIHEIYFAEYGKKIDIVKNIDPIFVVEDNPEEIKVLESCGVKCFLRAAWYNQSSWNDFTTIESLYDIDLENL